MPPETTSSSPPKDPKKIMGMPKWAFWLILAVGLILAYYLYKRNQSASNNTAASLGVDSSQGLTAADIGGTPSDYGTPYDTSGGSTVDNSAQIDALGQQLQSSLSDLSSQISGLASAGIGPTAASAPQSNNTLPTLPIDVTVTTRTTARKTAKPKPAVKHKEKRPPVKRKK